MVCGCVHDQSSAWRRPADNKAVLAKMEGRKWNARTGHLCNRCWQEATLPVGVHASTHVFTDKVSFFGGGMGMGA